MIENDEIDLSTEAISIAGKTKSKTCVVITYDDNEIQIGAHNFGSEEFLEIISFSREIGPDES